MTICFSIHLAVTASCNISHIPPDHKSSQMLSVSSASFCLCCVWIGIGFLPSLHHSFSPSDSSTLHPSLLLLTFSSLLPPVTVTRRTWIFSELGSVSTRCEAGHWPRAPWKVLLPPYFVCPLPEHEAYCTPPYPPLPRHLGLVTGGYPTDPSGYGGWTAAWARLQVCPSVWGRKSRRALAGAEEPGAVCPPLRTVGTRFNWQNTTGQSMALLPKKDRANFHSYPALFG